MTGKRRIGKATPDATPYQPRSPVIEMQDVTDCQLVRYRFGDDVPVAGDQALLGLAMVIATAICSATFWVAVLF